MNDTTLMGPWIRRFLLEHLVRERNLSRNTQRSYRDTLALLMPFVSIQSAEASRSDLCYRPECRPRSIIPC